MNFEILNFKNYKIAFFIIKTETFSYHIWKDLDRIFFQCK